MKAVILNGGEGSALFPLADYCSKLILPLADQPLLNYLLRFLQRNNIREVAIISSDHLDFDKSFIIPPDGIEISYFTEKRPRGTAGSLKDIETFMNGVPLLVVSGNVFVKNLDLSDVLSFHRSKKSLLTVVVNGYSDDRKDIEDVRIGEDDLVKGFNIPYHSRNARRRVRSTGLYVFDPSVFGYIPRDFYMDIKEQLIQVLNHKGIPVYAYKAQDAITNINTFTDYFLLHKEMLLNGIMDYGVLHSKSEIMEKIWVAESAKVSPKAYILGPVVIGDSCVVEDYVQLIGPTTVGSGSRVEKDVLVRESIVGNGAHLMNRCRIEHSMIGEGCVVHEMQRVKNSVVTNKGHERDLHHDMLHPERIAALFGEKNFVVSLTSRVLRRQLYVVFKRVLDTVLSSIGLFFSVPVFIAIAIAIKIDSRGSVLFSQLRCGKDGREFKMYKFRSMVDDAELLKKGLYDKNAVDGPMFKVEDDPRVTKVGGFLRRTSLDELPQLYNVLRGDMSLVGPRPLEMKEMAFSPSWRDLRLSVKPGITGLWQIRKEERILFDEWISSDTEYVRNRSLWLDLKILVNTFGAIYKGVKRRR